MTKTEISSKIFEEILKGKFKNTNSRYSKYYWDNDSDDSIIIYLENVDITGQVDTIKENNYNASIFLIDVTFDSNLSFDFGKFNSFYFLRVNAKGGISFSCKAELLQMIECHADNLGINHAEIDKIYILDNMNRIMHFGNFKSASVELLNVKSKHISFQKLFLENFIIKAKQIEDLDIRNSSFGTLQLTGNLKNGDVFKFTDLKIQNLNIQYLNNFGNILFKNIEPFQIYKNDKKSLIFQSSSIGNMEYKSSSLNLFDEIYIKNTDLKSLSTYNSTFPITKLKGSNKELYEIFNDLYSNAKFKNNRKEQSEYYKASQGFLLRSIIERNAIRKNIPSIVSLGISQIFSEFGTNWIRAAALTIFITFILFINSILFTGYKIAFTGEGWDNFKEFSPYFIQFLDPTHSITFMDGFKGIIFSLNFSFNLINFISRIFIAIGVFEIINSFRKYVRA